MNQTLQQIILQQLGESVQQYEVAKDDILTVVVKAEDVLQVSQVLQSDCGFEQLTDLAGVDYSAYGEDEWRAEQATSTGFSRGAERDEAILNLDSDQRFAVVYHLLSYQHNERLRLKVLLSAEMPRVSTVVSVWPVADWYEREAFDLFGIIFDGHPDLRRILTDYGFVGHPFRKDFPLSGEVEMRYDAKRGRVIYEPVEIAERIGVARVIRHDDRYIPDGLPEQGAQS